MSRWGFAGSAEVILGLLEQQWPFRPRELLKRGVSPAWIGLHPLVPLVRLDRGVYGNEGRSYPRVVIAACRTDRSFACLYSALWLHGLIREEPDEAWLCIGHRTWMPRGGRVPALFLRTRLWPRREDLCSLTDWNMPATTLARTAFDFFRFRHRVGVQAAREAQQLILRSGMCTEEEVTACRDRFRTGVAEETSASEGP
jgi:hypothetical protein